MSHHIVPPKTYYLVFTALIVLLILTVAAAEIEHDLTNIIVAITIAVTKATLIVLFFMHVKYSGAMVQVIIGAGVLWLILLFAITLSDYETRGWSTTTGAPLTDSE